MNIQKIIPLEKEMATRKEMGIENQTIEVGYSPACINEWKPGVCQKPKIKCSGCKHQDFLTLNEMTVACCR